MNSKHFLLTISKAGTLCHWMCCFPVVRSPLSAIPNKLVDEFFRSFSENISMDGDKKQLEACLKRIAAMEGCFATFGFISAV